MYSDAIEPRTEPTGWVSSLVIVKKQNGSLRLCLDPKDLNKAIKREHYQMPTTESILLKLAGAKLFTKLEASNAYWQIPVDEGIIQTTNVQLTLWKILL